MTDIHTFPGIFVLHINTFVCLPHYISIISIVPFVFSFYKWNEYCAMMSFVLKIFLFLISHVNSLKKCINGKWMINILNGNKDVFLAKLKGEKTVKMNKRNKWTCKCFALFFTPPLFSLTRFFPFSPSCFLLFEIQMHLKNLLTNFCVFFSLK